MILSRFRILQKLEEYVTIIGPDSSFLPPFDFKTAVDEANEIGMNTSYTVEHTPLEWNVGYVTPNAVQYINNIIPNPYTYDSAIAVQNHWIYQ